MITLQQSDLKSIGNLIQPTQMSMIKHTQGRVQDIKRHLCT